MKLLLDMYKGVSKDQRDKVQLMATEKKLRSEIEELRNQMKKIQVCMLEFNLMKTEVKINDNVFCSFCRKASVKNARN